jgi:hypothetical protein
MLVAAWHMLQRAIYNERAATTTPVATPAERPRRLIAQPLAAVGVHLRPTDPGDGDPPFVGA